MSYSVDLSEQKCKLPFSVLYSRDAVCIGGCLDGNQATDVAVEAMLVDLELIIDRGCGGQGGWVREDGIKMLNRVIVGCNTGQSDR